MTTANLVFKAGPGAFDSIRRHGFAPELIGTIAGASGGAKWLVLSQLDRAIVANVVPEFRGPVHTIATSIGAWRFACYAQKNPLAAIDRFERSYIDQTYSEEPDRDEISSISRNVVQIVLGENGVDDVLNHPVLRTSIMTVRARNIAASERPLVQAASLIAAAGLNAVSRRTLALFYERALFFDPRDRPPCIDMNSFSMQRVHLSAENLEDVIVATGSIPLVLKGVRDIDGAKPGVYRDGGIIDYHLDLPHSMPDRLTLYPHFYDHLVPGWFDKRLKWRRSSPSHVDRTLLVCPSAEFVAGLPNGKIPDRTDFANYSREDRVRIWRSVVASCEALADEFNNVIQKGQLEARLTRL